MVVGMRIGTCSPAQKHALVVVKTPVLLLLPSQVSFVADFLFMLTDWSHLAWSVVKKEHRAMPTDYIAVGHLQPAKQMLHITHSGAKSRLALEVCCSFCNAQISACR